MSRWTMILAGFGGGIVAGLAIATGLDRSPQEMLAESEARLVAAADERDRASSSLGEQLARFTNVSAERDKALLDLAAQTAKIASLRAELEQAKEALAKSGAEISASGSTRAGVEAASPIGGVMESTEADAPTPVAPAGLATLASSDVTTTFRVGDVRLQVEIDSTVVYLSTPRVKYDDGSRTLYGFLRHSIIGADGEIQFDKAGFYRVNGKAERISLRSGDTAILRLPNSTTWDFKRAGTVDVIIDLAGRTFKRSIRVIRIDVCEGDEAETVVEKFGLPDEDQDVFCSWPDTKSVDTVSYGPSASESIILAHHWRYRKWPGLVLSIVSDRVHRVASARPRQQ
jgi:hypothetical protein